MDNAGPRENDEEIPHPFAVHERGLNNRTCSAFNVVGNRNKGSQGHIATANSNVDSRHHRTIGSINENSFRTRSDDVNYVTDNFHARSQDRTNTHFDNRTSTLSHRVGFSSSAGITPTERPRLHTDAIGPGIILENSLFNKTSSSTRTLSNYNSNERGNNENSSKRLRRRGIRTNMSPNETASNAEMQTGVCEEHSGPGCNNCRNSMRRNAASNACDSRPSNSGNITSNVVRNRLNSDLELLSRPSWCDAQFAYDQVRNGRANGNKAALWFRSKVHRVLFKLGCFIQRRAGFVLIPCLIILGACAVGLKYGSLETNVEKLWVESGGVLESELEYSREAVGNDTGTTWQLLIQTGEDTATLPSLQLHLQAAVKAIEVKVTVYDQDWELSDLCYKNVPELGEMSPIFEAVVQKLFPCFIMGPLDCFFEGAALLGPSPPFAAMQYQGISFPPLTWKNLDPSELLDAMSFLPEVKQFQGLVERAGVVHGYQDRWCLDPHSPDCPDMSKNKVSKDFPDVKAILNAGCAGYATKLMKWPNDLIVGGIERDAAGNLTRARGLQTLIQLMGPQNMYNFHKESTKTKGIVWDIHKATNILTMWQRAFVEQMYNVEINASTFPDEPDNIHAFAPTTAQDLINEFSNFSIVRVAAGYLLMLAYACFTMLRCKASRSQGAVGLVGVLLVCLSVMAGLGICSVIGIKFNASTTQVLPFLMLGLGVDDMFLIAHQFGEIACLSHIPFEERTGECMKRVGVSVLLSSVAILCGFLFSMIIPMPALQSFALQAAIITCFNLFCVLFVFPAALSIDLERRKNNVLDIFCCFKRLSIGLGPAPLMKQFESTIDKMLPSSANDVVALTDTNDVNNTGGRSCDHAPPPVRFIALPAGPYPAQMDNGATITMHHTIQAFSNESYVTFLGPAAETTFGSGGNGAPAGSNNLPHYYPPDSPPPRYTPDPGNAQDTPQSHNGPRQAFQEPTTTGSQDTSQATISSTPNTTTSKIIHTRSEVAGSSPPTASSTTAASSNLVTPMVSVRSSTHSLVPTARSRASKWFNWRKHGVPGSGRSGSKRPEYEYTKCLPFISIPEFAKKYYGPFLMKTPVRIAVLIICSIVIGGSIYGCLQVKDGLDLVDVLPRDSREHAALSAQLEYFSFYNMHIVTQDFDYANKQRELHMLHSNMSNLKYVVRNSDGSNTRFWLEYMREWLLGLQQAFDDDWSKKFINASTWTYEASHDGVLAYKLLVQTGKFENPTDNARIGCEPPQTTPCTRINIVRLVSDDGIIREDGFYNYLTAWVQNDTLAYMASLALIVPEPSKWTFVRDGNIEIPRSRAITYAQMPYFLNGLRENDDFVDVIKTVRGFCDHYSTLGVRAYPSGYPFLFWQQYIDLRQWLFIAMGAAILAISLVVALVLLNPWAAAITGLFLIIITTELLGFLGVAGVKLSAVPAVILVAAVGLGVEFTVHVTLAFITSCGSRCDRSKSAMAHMMGPVLDGAISTFLGVVMLSGSEFDFIIRYFFHVLSILVLIGVWNGIVLLPVVLSFIGPPPEVVPVGGGNRLKTPTPPPTPPIEEEEHSCRNCNNNNIRRCRQHNRECCMARNYSSRDDVTCTQHGPCNGQDRCRHDRRPYYPQGRRIFEERGRYPPSAFHPYEFAPNTPFQYQINHGYCHPHSVGGSGTSTPQAALNDGRVVIYPSSDFVVYSPNNGRLSNDEIIHHCDSPVRLSTNSEPLRSACHPPGVILKRSGEETPGNSRVASSDNSSTSKLSDRGQHIATLTSSVTVKVHPPRHQHFPVYAPTSSRYGNHSSTESSTIDDKFNPITQHTPTFTPSNPRLVRPTTVTPISPEFPRDQAPSTSSRENFRNNANISESFTQSESIRRSANVDAASEAVDSAFQRLGNDDVIG